MAGHPTDPVVALLVQTETAHGEFEEAELKGVYDQDWPRWYAAYAVEHGIRTLVGHAITVEQLAEFLASTNAEFAQTGPEPREPWAIYMARRITAEM